jgi:hypothetical protein
VALKEKPVDFSPLKLRKNIFKDKIFVFFNELQLHKMQNIIELASGKCELFNESRHLNNKKFKENMNRLLFIQHDHDKFTESLKNQNKVEHLIER